jgi:hypothetical protein
MRTCSLENLHYSPLPQIASRRRFCNSTWSSPDLAGAVAQHTGSQEVELVMANEHRDSRRIPRAIPYVVDKQFHCSNETAVVTFLLVRKGEMRWQQQQQKALTQLRLAAQD